MPYRVDFYIRENIIGWTGQIINYPTVYFRSGNGPNDGEWGHITQFHSDFSNIGRETVRTKVNYGIENQQWPEGEYMVEANGAGRSAKTHRSRGAITFIDDLPPDARQSALDLLSMAIRNNLDEKSG